MSARVFYAAARSCLRSLLSPASVTWFVGLHLAVILLSLPHGDISPAETFVTRSQLLALLFWLPGLFVAVRFRDSWPAIGHGDAGLGWLQARAFPVRSLTFGAFLGGLAGLVVLQILTGVLTGAVVAVLPGKPAFRLARTLVPKGPEGPRLLARRGQYVEYELPARAGAGDLLIWPRFGFQASQPEPIELAARLGLGTPGEWQIEGIVVEDGQREVVVPLPESSQGGSLSIVRTSPAGVPIALDDGAVWLLSGRVSAIFLTTTLSCRFLGWSATLLTIGLLLSTCIGADLQRIALIGIAPTLHLLPFLADTAAGRNLAAGLCQTPEPPAAMLILTLVIGGAGGVLLPRAKHRPGSEQG